MRRTRTLPLLLPWLVFFSLLLAVAATATAPGVSQPPRKTRSKVSSSEFVRRSCRRWTRYPRVCESTLLPRAPAVGGSPRRLARAALLVGADRAANWSSYLQRDDGVRSSGGGAVRDCLEMARSAEDQLRRSAAEMERPGRAGTPRFALRLGNARTWTSAALTDVDTCLDSLDEDDDQQGRSRRSVPEPDRDAVRRRAVAVAQAASNALALVTKLQPAAAAP